MLKVCVINHIPTRLPKKTHHHCETNKPTIYFSDHSYHWYPCNWLHMKQKIALFCKQSRGSMWLDYYIVLNRCPNIVNCGNRERGIHLHLVLSQCCVGYSNCYRTFKANMLWSDIFQMTYCCFGVCFFQFDWVVAVPPVSSLKRPPPSTNNQPCKY